MGAFEGLLYGLQLLLSPELLLAALVGALAGTVIGVLPGLGPVAGAALVLPLTFTLEPAAALIMIAGIYAGSMYGGSTTAVLLNMPGEAASVVTTVDGYKMTQRGRGGVALSVMAVGSFIAGTIAILLVMLFAPVLADVGIAFGPREYLALTVGGLLLLARISGGSAMSGFFPMVLGLALATVGQEKVTNAYRYVFGMQDLSLGIDLVPVAIGLFGIAEMLRLIAGDQGTVPRPAKIRLRELVPTRAEWKRAIAPWGRGSVIGFLFGLLPGPSATLSSFASYRVEKAVSKHRKEIGDGAVEGVAGPEAANNSAAMGGLVPVLSLGLPFSATFALMISAMIVQGIQPGPLLISDHPDVFWSLIAAMYLANIMLLLLNLPLVGVWVSLLRIPQGILLPAIFVIAVIGAYSTRENMLDVVVLLAMGVIGYFLHKLDFNLTSLVIGLVLGGFVEKHLREGLFLSRGDMGYFVGGSIAPVLWVIVLVVLVGGTAWRLLQRRREAHDREGDTCASA